MQRQKHICLLLDSSSVGGIESHVFQLARALLADRQQVEVIFLSDHGIHPMQQSLSSAGVDWSVNRRGWLGLYDRFRREPPDVLHTHGYKAGILGRLVGRIAQVTLVSTYHAGETGRGRLAAYDFIDRWSGCLADRRLAVSKPIAERLPFRTSVIDNFVDLPNSLSRGRQIAFVGRISHEKGPDYLLGIAKHAPADTFHIYGDGDLAADLVSTAPHNVIFHGNQNNMGDVWPRIGLLVMPSRQEGLPMAALEAMAHGIPVVASRVGALPQLIQHRHNGYLCGAGDLMAYLNSIRHWQSSYNQRQMLSRNARATIQRRYSAETVLPQILRHYRALPACP
jgi:glycosyltransferase involved in cell wall biosynthesis